MASPAVFSLEHLNLQDISQYNSGSDEALRLYCDIASAPRFFLMTKPEIDEIRDDLIDELDLTCCLSILSALEAAFRVDYIQRCKKRLKDPLSKAFRTLHKNPSKRDRISLEGDLLALWNTHHPAYKQLIGQFKAAIKYRNWLAHGRYWIIKPNHKFDFQSLYLISSSIIATLPLQDAD